MKKKKKEKPLTRAKAKVRMQKTQTNPALVDLKRQLRIEASLDRVRRKALSMKKPDDLLNICKTLYTELQLLGFDELRNSIINIHNDDNESIVNYDCAKTGASINHFTYRVHPAIESLVRQMKSGRAAFSEGVMTGKKLKEFFKAFRKSHGEKIDAEIRNAKALYYYFYSTGTGALGISNLAPLGAGQLKILKRFRNVFDLAYRRYTDIQKAEAQAREAQIEAALEKVRSRSLAMHKSDELREVVKEVFDRLQELNFVLEDGAVSIFIFKEHSKDHIQWIADPGHSYATPFELAYSDHSMPRDLFTAKESDVDYFSKIYPTKEKNEYFNYLFAETSYKYLPIEVKELILGSSQYGFSVALTRHAAIVVPTNSGRLLSESEKEILKRFARVFEQTYTRFLDLQKAEAQARESQIEAALEKIRSRSLAMQKSMELREVVATVFHQMQKLGFDIKLCNILLFDPVTLDVDYWLSFHEQEILPESYRVPYLDHAFYEYQLNAWRNQTTFEAFELSGAVKATWDDYLIYHTDLRKLSASIKEIIPKLNKVVLSSVATRNGLLQTATVEPLSDESISILQRFAKVFNQSYTRFLDLQKAEAQAHEAQIEAALERVRSRSMAMHKSEELLAVITVVSQQLEQLKFKFNTVSFAVNNQEHDYKFWFAVMGDPTPLHIQVPYISNPMYDRVKEILANGIDFYADTLTPEESRQWHEHVFLHASLPALTEETKAYILRSGYARSVAITPSIMLIVSNYAARPYTDDENDVIRRFASVFQQSYTRFLDLQKAEAQAREAQIEAALERVRARTMAMQKSDELADVAGLMFQQVRELGFSAWTTGFNVWSDDNNTYTDYVTSPLGGFIEPYTIDATVFPSFKEISDAKKRGEEFWVQYLEGEALKQTYLELSKFGDKGQYVKMREGGFEFPTRQFDHFVFLSNISLMFITYDPVPEAHELFKRFGKVFEQTYTRFLDLQKAEAQAREAQVEAALEKIRSRSLAMHRSDELKDVVAILFEKLKELGLIFDGGAGIHLFTENSRDAVIWVASPELSSPICNGLPYDEKAFENNPIILDVWAAKDSGVHLINKTYSFEEKNKYFDYVFKYSDASVVSEPIRAFIMNARSYTATFIAEKNSLLGATSWSEQVFSGDDVAVLKRVARVFEQAYIRFLDLQKAEAQAREAKIEASLERVRGKAMAMHSSADLAATIGIFYRELESFSITPRRCGVGVVDKETRIAEISTMNTTDKGDSIEVIGKLKMEGHPVLEGIFDSWILQQEYHPVLRGNEIKEYYQLVRPQISFPEYPHDAVQFGYFFPVPELSVYAWTDKELGEDELKIYRKFTSVLSLTHKRYKDLKDAEFRAKEAVKQATLDRVRAEIASMRTKQDLDRITPLIWNELTILGIPFVRCGVFIMDDKHQLVHTFLSTPEGKAIGAFQLDYETKNLKEAIRHWHDRQVYVTHWGEKEFGELAGILLKQGSISSLDQYLNTLPTGGIYLHFLPFMQGMLYVGNTSQLQQEDIHLLQSLAEAFSTAYARYDDFNKLEAAKQQVEKTLVDLKQAQQQLIQSEKMASLGELTAGIAHEIQNPLNFVNNFAEVSNELIDEMVEEVKKGNFDEAKIIANDLRQNLEKINHHGKRADGIVKSMLQHSRTSSGQKELTDINVLCDEYLRLSYHGLRAKDKSFNAKFETDFDSTLEKINVIPQDIGRVILNLINNAFYAVTEKRNADLDGYEPTVSVSTKQLDDKVEIVVKDNGNGIPQKVLDKIFQPFFTTKPTGQGTGLGLSLSYDILKGHGGELKVETEERVGTEFTIHLPKP